MQRRTHQRGYPSRISFQFTGATHIHTEITMMNAESFSIPPANGSFVMPTHEARQQYLRTRGYPSQISNVTPFTDTGGVTGVRISEYSSPGNNPQPPLSFRYVPFTHVNEFTGVQTPAGRESSGAGYRQQTQNAGRTYVPGHNIGPAPFLPTDVAGPEYPRDWRYPQPSGGLYNGGFTSGSQMDAVGPGSITGGYNPGGPGANLTPGLQTPAVGLGLACSSGVGYNQVTPNATLGFAGQTLQAPFLPDYDTKAAAPPVVGVGLNNGGFTSAAQMDAVRPGSVTGGYNPGGPGASLTPGVQTPAVGLGPAGSSGVGYNQLSPIATLGFAGQTSQAPFLPEYDTQAAAPPPTLDQQLFPPSRATAANNDFAEDFLPPAVSDNFMHMLESCF